MKLYYDSKINCDLVSTNPQQKIISLQGPLGKVHIFLGPRYKNHGLNYIELNTRYITQQNIRLLKHLNNGLIVGFRKRIYQSGIWTLMKKIHKNVLSFKLGFSHQSLFKIPNHLLFRSKRVGQFRTINLYSISYQLVADTAAHLIRLRNAKATDVYRLNGFRYALPRIFGPRATNIRIKVGKKK